MTGAISWRRGDVRYKKNEAFVDVVENVNLLMSAKGILSIFEITNTESEISVGRNRSSSGCGWPNSHARLFVRDTGVQVWSQ